MSVRRVLAIFLRQWFVLKGSASRIFIILYWPMLELFLWGVLTVYLEKLGLAELNFVTVIMGAVLLYELMGRIQHGIAVSSLEDVWYRNFINLFASPLSVKEYVGGLVLTAILVGGISFSAMSVFSWFLFSYNIFQFGPALLPFAAVLFLFGMAIGIFSLALTIRFGPAVETLTWALPAFFGPFSGVFYPVSVLPSWAQWFAKFLPSSYVFEGMRSLILSGTFDFKGLVISVALALGYIFITYFILLWSYRLALKNGLLGRFIAENF